MVPILFIRSSSYNAHRMCPAAYFIEYVLGHKGKSGLAANMGTITHKCLEILAIWKFAYQNKERSFEDDIIGKCNFKSLKVLRDENNNKITLDELVEKIYNHYSSHSPDLKWTPAKLRESKRWFHKALAYNNGKMNPLNQKIVCPEQFFDIEMKGEWAKYYYELKKPDGTIEILEGMLSLKGTIDLITKVDKDTYEIIDYKTGARKDWATGAEYDFESLRNSFQLRLYHFVISKLYPDIKNIITNIYFINKGGAFPIKFTQEDIPETIRMIKNKFEEIKNTNKLKPKRSWKCTKFCHFGKNTFEGTNVKPIKAKNCRIAKNGQDMTMCDQVLYSIEKRNLELVVENMTKENYDLGFYQMPGSVQGEKNDI